MILPGDAVADPILPMSEAWDPARDLGRPSGSSVRSSARERASKASWLSLCGLRAGLAHLEEKRCASTRRRYLSATARPLGVRSRPVTR